jgi:uncharacterized protein with PQ loop repeat
MDFILSALMGIITVCAYIGYIPQIITLIKTKYSKDLSITSWSIWLFSTACGTVYSILLKRPELFIMYVSEFILSVIIFALIIKYRKNARN